MHWQIFNLRRFLACFSSLLFATLTTPAQEYGFDVWTTANHEIKNVFQNPSNAPEFRRFTGEDGLSQNTVWCILHDSRGFLWAGTYNGLNRFDGYQFVTYKYDFRDKNSLSDNQIFSIYETKSGQVWVGTGNGLNRYNLAADGFDAFKFDAGNPKSLSIGYVKAIFEDRDGTLWLGTDRGGLSKFDKTTENFTNYQNDENNAESLSGNNVSAIGEDPNGQLWIATLNGLNKFNRETGRFARYQVDQNNPSSLSSNEIRAMLIDRSGIIWLGTADGLHKFDPNSNQFTRYLPEKNIPTNLSANTVLSICETKSGTLWVGTRSGLNSFSKETNNFIFSKNDPTNPRSLAEGEIWSIYEDDTEQLWVGSTVGGLNKFNQKTSRFLQFRHDANNPNSISQDNILSIFEDKHKTLWIGTRRVGTLTGVLHKYDQATGRFEVVKNIGDSAVVAICEDRDGKLWFGTDKNGLIYFDRENDRFISYRNDPNNPNSLSQDNITKIYEDRAGFLWIGTYGRGLNKFDRAAGKFTRFQYNPNDPESLSDNKVISILEDSFAQLWIGTPKGLNKYDPVTQSFTHFNHEADNAKSLSASDVDAIYEDKNGTLWIGTISGGLNRFDRNSETFTHFTEREGLPNNTVYDIFEDAEGNLWFSTDKGLARFNIETHGIRNFDVNDGLTHNEFNHRAAFKNQNGEMFFGGFDGFVRFNPKDFGDGNFKPPIVLTGIRIFEQPLKITENITELKELNLSWRDYVVSFDFAALDFTDPKKLQYQWKLEGFDNEWIHGGTRRTATYTNLAGGEYVLKVKATNADGVWSKESLNLKIIVTPPFYRTFWFSGLAAAFIGLLIWLIYSNRINQLRSISETQTKFTQQLIELQEAERKRIASELHDGLGQSLAIISNRAAMGKSNRHEPEVMLREFEEISQNALEALDEVQQITSNLHPHYLERLGLTKALKAMLSKLSDVIELNSKIDSIDNIFPKESEINVYRIVQESFNNIIKHSHASEAEITIKRVENEVVITIKDDGRGFDPINFKAEGSGLGLVGLRERTNMLGGKISINSSAGNGTEIKVSLPVKSS